MKNPYLEAVIKNDLLRKISSYKDRESLVREYAWSVPTDEAIEEIVKLSPIVEGGAGTGYWASLISKAGGDIICYDIAPPGEVENDYKHTKQHHLVNLGGAEKIAEHSDRSLLLCWPPYQNQMGYEHISSYKGKILILIGEGRGGCCGDGQMFDYIENNFIHKKSIYIPQWFGIYDDVNIYSRKI